jgi:uncharacterized membrane protein
MMTITLTNPLALLLLLAIPYILWVGWPRLQFRQRRDTVSLVLRVIILTSLIMGVAGLHVTRAAGNIATVFLVDVSDSMDESAQDAAFAWIQESLEAMAPDDEAAVVMFGRDALVERPMSPVKELNAFTSTPITLHTDLEKAIRLGLALYPPGAARRMVILSDGQTTLGDTEAAARLAQASGVQVDFVPFERQTAAEVLVTDVRAPTTLNEGQTFEVVVTIESRIATPATLTLSAANNPIFQSQIQLEPGTNTERIPITAGTGGFIDFRASVELPSNEADTFYQNNALSAFSRVTGAPQILLVVEDSASAAEVETLAPALEAIGTEVDVRTANRIPASLAELAGYEAIVLANVPATTLNQAVMEQIQVYVRDLGGGLVVSGGPDSYGIGGYFKTPLEEALPVEMQLRDQQRLPQLTLYFVIDRSGSMDGAGPSGVTKLELAKEAVIRSMEFLNPIDRVAVIAFDTSAYWVVDPQQVSNLASMQSMVGTLRAGGGTRILSGLTSAAEVLPGDESLLRHIVVLSDGGDDPRGIAEMAARLYEQYEITTSTVAIGQGSAPFLYDVARAGRGRYHEAIDISTIPSIFTAETVMATRSYLIEEEFFPTLINPGHPIMRGILRTPSLLGYVATTPKATSQVLMSTHQNDPLLSAWQYGLGRSVAWTSDATNRWATNWTGWDNFPRFWAQAVAWTINEGSVDNVETEIVHEGETARIVVDVRGAGLGSAGESFLNGLELEARVIDSGFNVNSMPLQQVAPGLYEATFTPREEGAYFIRVEGSRPGEEATSVVQTTGWVLSYSPEYRDLSADVAQLEAIAEITGGTQLESPEGAFAPTQTQQDAATPVWPTMLLLATVLLPVDIAVRRLVITQRDLRRAYQSLMVRLGRLEGEEVAPAQYAERMTRLQDAKSRADERASAAETESLPPAYDVQPPEVPEQSQVLEEAEAAEAREGEPEARQHGPSDQTYRHTRRPRGTLASRLLNSKRDRETDEEGGEEES